MRRNRALLQPGVSPRARGQFRNCETSPCVRESWQGALLLLLLLVVVVVVGGGGGS